MRALALLAMLSAAKMMTIMQSPPDDGGTALARDDDLDQPEDADIGVSALCRAETDNIADMFKPRLEADFALNAPEADDSVSLATKWAALPEQTTDPSVLRVNAGDGNETISGVGLGAILNGGDDDDTIIVRPDFYGVADGSADNDVILTSDSRSTDAATLDGGARDDQIISADALQLDITLRKGADTLVFAAEAQGSIAPITFNDFAPAEDALVSVLGVDTPDEVEFSIVSDISKSRNSVRATVPAAEAGTYTEFGSFLYLNSAQGDIAIANTLPMPVVA